MGHAKRWTAVALSLGLACALRVSAADFTLTPAELQRIAARQIVIRANVDSGQRRGTVRAAVRIEAAPAIVFKMMTTCADALQYVPHLKVCRVRDRALDDSWLLVEHEIDFGWYAPRVKFAFHADLVADRSIAFHQVTGDFKAYEGVWDLEPADKGAHTLLLYRAYIDPPGYVPSWLARSTFKRELPQMLTELRRRCEAKQSASTGASVSPH